MILFRTVAKEGGDKSRVSGALLRLLPCLIVFLTAGCSGSETSQQAAKEAESRPGSPNIIFVLTDDLDFASAQKMPQIRSQLVDEGASFEEAFVSYPVCCPSRATILTGLYAHNHGVASNEPPNGGFEKFLAEGHEENTTATGLQEAGYQTALFGKYMNEYPGDDPTHVPPGWDEWYGKLDPGEHKLYNYRINENGEVLSYGSETEDYFTDILSKQATDFVRRAAPEPEPFFAYVAPTAPHGPATPAERHKGAFASEEAPRAPSFDEEDISDKPVRGIDRISEEEASDIEDYYRQRLESMLAVDDMVGALVEELEAAGELDDTYIFFTSDNGWLSGEHRIQEGKKRLYEEAAHVPLFVRGPRVAPGSTIEELTLNTDFAPTFADLANSEISADGRSLTPLLRGEDPPWRSAVLLEILGQSHFEGVRTKTHKYVEYENGRQELYDLLADPYELESLHESADPSLLEDLQAKLDALKGCTEEGCREAEDNP
jgi:N-acetylglucosamine-6-sulfatase